MIFAIDGMSIVTTVLMDITTVVNFATTVLFFVSTVVAKNSSTFLFVVADADIDAAATQFHDSLGDRRLTVVVGEEYLG